MLRPPDAVEDVGDGRPARPEARRAGEHDGHGADGERHRGAPRHARGGHGLVRAPRRRHDRRDDRSRPGSGPSSRTGRSSSTARRTSVPPTPSTWGRRPAASSTSTSTACSRWPSRPADPCRPTRRTRSRLGRLVHPRGERRGRRDEGQRLRPAERLSRSRLSSRLSRMVQRQSTLFLPTLREDPQTRRPSRTSCSSARRLDPPGRRRPLDVATRPGWRVHEKVVADHPRGDRTRSAARRCSMPGAHPGRALGDAPGGIAIPERLQAHRPRRARRSCCRSRTRRR